MEQRQQENTRENGKEALKETVVVNLSATMKDINAQTWYV